MVRSRVTCLPTAVPLARQLEFQEWEFGLFLHFGIRTFYEGHRDWDGKPMSASQFSPTQLDCDQWATTAKDAGMKYLVLTAKHHDGFANWPSCYSDFSVVHAPWKGGKGDVIREFTEACWRHHMKIGLYYSPAEWTPRFSDPKSYDDHFVNQLSELLTGYGEIDMLWFDGCGSENHEYDWPRIMTEVRRLQPKILVFETGGDPDYRWAGNEAGIAPYPCWNTGPAQGAMGEPLEGGRPVWLPVECNSRMRLENWFYSDADEHAVKSIEELMGLYYYSVGRGCNMLINIGPDRRGLLPDKDAARLREFGAEIRRRFRRPLLTLADWEQVEGGWKASPGKRILIDHLVIQENLRQGEHVRRFAVEVVPADWGVGTTVHEGHGIGHKAICQFPSIPVHSITLRVLETDGPVTLRRLDAHDVAGASRAGQ
jgi:alpha-L-fucosidase